MQSTDKTCALSFFNLNVNKLLFSHCMLLWNVSKSLNCINDNVTPTLRWQSFSFKWERRQQAQLESFC